MTEFSEMFHVGIVVPDLEEAKAHLTALLGIEWGPVLASEIKVRDGIGTDVVVPNRICYSTSPPYLELIQEVRGSVWECNEYSNLHHIGYYSGDLSGASGRLGALNCPLELMDGHGDGPPEVFAYHRDPLGVRLEMVNELMRDGMEAYLCRPPTAD